jgi:hypothetical protein
MPSSSSTWIWPTGGEPESGFEGILPMLLLERAHAAAEKGKGRLPPSGP